MYLPAHFNETRTHVMHALMRLRPFTTLITTIDQAIVANHVPVETLDQPKPFGLIRGHVARANPLWRDYRESTPAMAIFQGPDAYISPSFYATKSQSGEVVPTWNYAVVHAQGTLRFMHDVGWLREFVARLTADHESARPVPWTLEDAPATYIDKMLKSIVGFELTITKLTGKWKISQNRALVDRVGVSDGLRRTEEADSIEIATMIAARETQS